MPKNCYKAGKIEDAIKALASELRNDPTDVRNRTFLFEFLCFMGEMDRAEKQLDILSDMSKEAGMGTLLYRSAIQAERLRREMFEKKAFPQTAAATDHTVIGQRGRNSTLSRMPTRALDRVWKCIRRRLLSLAAVCTYYIDSDGSAQTCARPDLDSRYSENRAQMRRP